ncbi:MAG: SGNH/GDSL hydrolase family protein [Oscillospiraceae bacterium]|nr:SGNH/GDSL hydrolase family protein [Oscillospiraceae bacterium]
MKNILCFGDSNTYGVDIIKGGRLARTLRYTGILQKMLGDDYHIIEEGYNGRTTVFDDPVGEFRNGYAIIDMILQTHIPLDLVIIMLGTNDTKTHFAASAATIAKGLRNIVRKILRFDYSPSAMPEILIVSPIHIGYEIEKSPFSDFDVTSYEKSLQLASEYQKVAAEYHCHFFDASTVAEASPLDQIHLDEDGHESLAMALVKRIRAISR